MDSNQPEKDFEVAIVGGGICGLALACALAHKVKMVVFETAPAFGEIGAGVGLGQNALNALKGIGVLDAIVRKSDDKVLKPRGFEFYFGNQGHELIYKYPINDQTLGLGIHRAAMLDALVELLPPNVAQLNKRCISVKPATIPGEKGIVYFEDGSEYQADLIVGTDGIKSVVRSVVDPLNTVTRYMNTIAYRGLFPISNLKAFRPKELECPRMYAGFDKHIICFPVKDNTLLNVVAFACDRSKPYGEVEHPLGLAWVAPVEHEELLREYEGWGPQVQDILQNMSRPSKWTLYALQPPLESFVRQNIVLVGDAAHAMLPHLGAGVGQGLEDVHLLSKLLTHPGTTRAKLQDVLQAYDIIRVPRANSVLQASTRAGEVWEGRGESGSSFSGRHADTVGIWDWIWCEDLDKQVADALEYLKY